VCETLNLDPKWLRRKLLAELELRDRRLATR
jgi:hypothetical protein